jgi:multidrug efflux pump subunit AcrA (membrane-fusion protein)
MKKRQVIIIGIAAAILIIARLGMNALATPEEKAPKKVKHRLTTVFTEKVQNDSVPVYVNSTGVLEAVKRMELYSEVQGIMEADNGRFKAGNFFQRGELLLAIQSNDQRAQLYSQRSDFESLLTSVMPDLKADYPEEFPAWSAYLDAFSTESMVKKLPEVQSEKLKSFLVGRGVYSNYHSLNNTEIVNQKYTIRAPYDGVLIAANVDPGTVIRPGQALGVFIQPQHYELETSVDAATAERLQVGQKVSLSMQGLAEKKWEGNIVRIVKAIDRGSQMSTFFVAVEAEDLKEGMFLEAKVKAREVPNAIELSRSALLGDDKVFVVEEGKLVLRNVQTKHKGQHTVIITGLNNGDEVLTKIPPSAFEGMKVSIYQED